MAAAPESPLALQRAIAVAATVADGVAAAALLLPAIAIAGPPVRAHVWQEAVATGIAGVAWLLVARAPRNAWLAPVGVAMAAVAAWLLAQASYPVAAWLVAPTLGTAVAFVTPPSSPGVGRLAPATLGAALGVAIVVATSAFGTRDAAMAAGAALVAAAAAAAAIGALRGGLPVLLRPRVRGRGAATLALVLGGPALAVITAAYIGATTPSATWFGSLIHNGPRDSDMVAVTFDDGPNPPFTLQIARILDEHGVKGTFFTVGKALEARPDVSMALLHDGHLLGNHSYHHDAFRWLDPRYPELDDTGDAFKRTLGVCPAFYRPPHGSHTPFMARVVEDRGMRMVTWDVSAGDWATTDTQLVAKRILDRVRPGSIILLHDGIDGNIGADRTVILQALPLILDGLRERGLNPVTLDKLLGVPGYLPSC